MGPDPDRRGPSGARDRGPVRDRCPDRRLHCACQVPTAELRRRWTALVETYGPAPPWPE